MNLKIVELEYQGSVKEYILGTGGIFELKDHFKPQDENRLLVNKVGE